MKKLVNTITNFWLVRKIRLFFNAFYVNMLIIMYETIYKNN